MKRWFGFLLKALVSTGILVLVVRRIDTGAIGALLGALGAATVVSALALALLQTLLGVHRWVLVIRGLGLSVREWEALQVVYAGMALNQGLPAYVGGDAYKIYWLYGTSGQLAPAVRSVLIDRVSAVIALVAMMVIGLPWLLARFDDATVKVALLAMGVCGAVGTVALFTGDALPRTWRRLRVLEQMAVLAAAARSILLTPRPGMLVMAQALLVHVMSATVMYVFAAGMDIPLRLVDALLLMPPITLLSAVPISIAGWGVREGVMVGVLGGIGIGAERALALSLALGVTMLVNSLIGVVPLVLGGQRFRAFRAEYLAASGGAGRVS
jgi:glycosyltransferase 2 family protein